MNALEIKLNAVIEILENKEKKINNVIDYLKESKSDATMENQNMN